MHPRVNNTFIQDSNRAGPGKFSSTPALQESEQRTEDAMAFQLWVSKQSHNLSKLKVFHAMAKSVNDQQ